MEALVDEEISVKESQEPSMARRLAKLLMLSRDRRLNAVKLNELKRGLDPPDDYVVRILAKYPEPFRVTNCFGRRSSMEVELLRWDPELAVSAVEKAAIERCEEPRFVCSLPPTWLKTREKFEEFNQGILYKIYTMVLREGYRGPELVNKDPLVIVKDKFGELMQEGIHEYNRRRHQGNLEKMWKKGEILMKPRKEEVDEDESEAVRLDRMEKREDEIL